MNRKLLQLLLILGLSASVGSAQNLRIREGPRFSVYKAFVGLVGAAGVVTIQQPASGSKKVHFEAAMVYCSVACVIELERDGTAATATAATEVALTPYGTATAVGWSSSDVGNGTTINTIDVAAGSTVPIDLVGVMLAQGGGTAENFTLRSDSITGDIKMTIIWRED